MDDIKKKLFAAQSVEEVAQILKEAGEDEAKAEKAWQEVCQKREEMGQNLSLDELDAVAGGGGINGRDWYDEGCAATVEPGSDCTFTDGGCLFVNIDYSMAPVDKPCIWCGAPTTSQFRATRTGLHNSSDYAWKCRVCRRGFYLNTDGEWIEIE